MKNSSAHLLAQHGDLLQVGSVIVGEPLQLKSGRLMKAIGVAALSIAVAAGAGHFTQGVREESARIAAAEKAKAARVAEEKRIAAIQVVGLKQRLTALQSRISSKRDALLERFGPLLANRETDPDVDYLLQRYPVPIKPLQGIDPVAFEVFIELDRDSWVANGTSPKLDEHYQTENAKIQEGMNYLDKINRELLQIAQGKTATGPKTETRELKDPASPAKPAASRSMPAAQAAPEPLMPLETSAPAPAAKPHAASTGVPGKVQVLDW
ncbi:hypothetical protein [Pseudomonas fontis]|uniref:Uncharacterized protein n=1 Tax=Pseudomonas fontis TaxID=2942633 RepID=A0ABT5NQV5_9PSED|nr:hypothetical protein [Pseudomonas fontis]MDD0972638.1 hypothetical protein [Pseudomonas fontis]MDD0990558.1 hypothetical protein [Pseudomonas fontis]